MRCVSSALAQTYRNLEVLVSDDASTDDTWSRLSEIKDPRLVLARQPQALGLAGNFDFCLRRASGEYFLLLGDDDVLLPGAVERLAGAFQHSDILLRETIGLAWCPCSIVNAAGRELWRTRPGPAGETAVSFIEGLWRGKRGPRLSSILHRTADALEVGGYQPRYGDMCDTGLFGPVALLRGHVICVNEFLVQYTNHHGSTTSQSDVSQWQDWARLVHSDIVAFARDRENAEGAQRLNSAEGPFITGVGLTIMMQTVGRPGWITQAVREAVRSPGTLLTPYVARRLFTDGFKLLRLGAGY